MRFRLITNRFFTQAFILTVLISITISLEDVHALGKKRGNKKEKQRLEALEAQLRKTQRTQRELEARLKKEKEQHDSDIQTAEKQRQLEAEVRKLGREVLKSASVFWTPQRCETDSLDNNQAPERMSWAIRCIGERSDAKTREWFLQEIDETALVMLKTNQNQRGPRGNPYYPTFGALPRIDDIIKAGVGYTYTPQITFIAPADRNADCAGLPHDDGVIGICEASCYTPEQRVLFPSGYIEIAVAREDGVSEIVTLAPDATLDKLTFKIAQVGHFTASIQDVWHEIIELRTLSGKRLRVTKNHPILTASGEMKNAEQLNLGEALLTVDGNPDPITDLTGGTYFGKVHNVRAASDSTSDNIVIAEGLLTGSSFYQNEGIIYLNRVIMRNNLPYALLESR